MDDIEREAIRQIRSSLGRELHRGSGMLLRLYMLGRYVYEGRDPGDYWLRRLESDDISEHSLLWHIPAMAWGSPEAVERWKRLHSEYDDGK